MSGPEVLGFLAAPDREISLHAVSRALLKVRAIDGMTCEKLAKALDCSIDTIRAASNEENLLSLDSALRLCWFFPQETTALRALVEPSNVPLSAADHRAAIEYHASALAGMAA